MNINMNHGSGPIIANQDFNMKSYNNLIQNSFADTSVTGSINSSISGSLKAPISYLKK